MSMPKGRPAAGEPAELADIPFGGPATYRIVVQGALCEDWSDRLAGLAISSTSRGEAAPNTTLVGAVRDQAALVGVLDSLYDLHLPILEVLRIADRNERST